MPQLEKIDFDYRKAEAELDEFRTFLKKNEAFKETEVVKLLKERPHLSCVLGIMVAGLPKPNAYKFEFQIQGAFKADFVVGNTRDGLFLFVEFEGGEENSLFGPRETNQLRCWSSQLERGFGQLVDWAWALNDLNDTLKNNLQCDRLQSQFLLICGRDHFMQGIEKGRFHWRKTNIKIGALVAPCMTYDDVLQYFEDQLAAIRSLVK
jgi:hypothetical protein